LYAKYFVHTSNYYFTYITFNTNNSTFKTEKHLHNPVSLTYDPPYPS